METSIENMHQNMHQKHQGHRRLLLGWPL